MSDNEISSRNRRSPSLPNAQIDLLGILSIVWKGRIFIAKRTLLVTILGIIIAVLIPNSYESNTVFVPQNSGDIGAPSFGGLASLAGIDLNSMGASSSEISPSLYPRIVYSVPFKRDMLHSSVIVSGRQMTYLEYLEQRQVPVLNLVRKYTIGLPVELIKLFKKKKEPGDAVKETTYGLKVSDKEFEFMKGIENTLSLEINEKGGFIRLTVADPNPYVAAQLTFWAQKQLQNKVISYKIQNTKEIYEYSNQQFQEKQVELFSLQDKIAEFIEQNRNISSEFLQNRFRRLESEYDMVNSVYIELAQQKEQAALQLKKDTPIFSIIDPVRVPNERSSPSRSMIVIVFCFFGMLLSVAYLQLKQPAVSLWKNVKGE